MNRLRFLPGKTQNVCDMQLVKIVNRGGVTNLRDRKGFFKNMGSSLKF